MYVLELLLDGSIMQYEWRLISCRVRYSISYAPSCEEQTRSFHSGIIPYRSCGVIKRRFLFKSPRTYKVQPICGSDKILPHSMTCHRLAGTETFRESPAHSSLVSSSSSSSRGFSCDVKTRRAKLRNAVPSIATSWFFNNSLFQIMGESTLKYRDSIYKTIQWCNLLKINK